MSFPVHLIGDTIKRFREHYGAQFPMGPTIKIEKHFNNRARDFAMPGVEILFQVNTNRRFFLENRK